MADPKKVLALFLRATAKHAVTVKLDANGYRHLRCQQPGTWCCGFDIITYPGSLVFNGDMGCFVFSRLADMFQFFRDGRARGGPIRINASYWHEKLDADDRFDGSKEFSFGLFKSAVVNRVRESSELTAKERREVMTQVRNEILVDEGCGAAVAYQRLHDFDDRHHVFSDFLEVNTEEYTHRFLWCCHALVWAIREYDALPKTNDPAAASATAIQPEGAAA